MFYSEHYNFLFIASPKTGTRSVEACLSEIDPNGEKWKIPLDNKTITSIDVPSGTLGHARAYEFKKAMGPNEFNKINTFGFIRHPFEKLVSTYFFNKKLKLINAFSKKGNKNRVFTIFSGLINALAPKILSFEIWALIFPLKTNKEYFTDLNGKLIVNYLGRTEYLNSDLKMILTQFGVKEENIRLKHINRTSHRDYEEYFKNDFFRKIMEYRFQEDIYFYNEAVKNIERLYT